MFKQIPMKAIYNIMLTALMLMSMTSCSQSPSGVKSQNDPNQTEAPSKSGSKNNLTEVFKEGKIDLRITTPGTALGKLLQQVDPAKGNVSEQMKALTAKLSAKERLLLDEQSKKAGMMNLAILMLPLKSVIYIKGDDATAKFDALTFHGENTVNEAKKEGMMYVKSQNSGQAMTISYTGESFKEMTTNELKVSEYDIVNTGETKLVAGYTCTKSVYTLKKANAEPKVSPSGMPHSGSIYQLEVWTSKQMPKAVNFLHPLYINENAGIMEILMQYDKASELKILYEFTKVESRSVSATEMAIKKTEKINDFGKDKMTVGMQMMGIVFGM